jgi:hypothetical protein
MLTKEIAGWTLSFAKKEDKVTIKVTHADNSPISDTDADIGADGELGFRLTSQAIEDNYDQNGDLEAEPDEGKILLGNWKFEVISDEDNHLNIFCIHTTSESLKCLSPTTEAEPAKEYEIVITDADYLY